MNIFVLEDDFLQQSHIEAIIQELLMKHKMSYQFFDVFGKPDQLIEAITEKGGHQLFFLDIEIKAEEQKGLDVAKQIREIDPYAVIVFVTTHSEFMPISFQLQVSALDYIDKSLSEVAFRSRIESVLQYVYDSKGRRDLEDSFVYESLHAQVQTPFKDILYIETSPHPHRVILYTEKDRIEFTANLSEFVKQDKRLYRCHRSFVVNPVNIARVDKGERILYFHNGASCLIARTKMKGILEAIATLHKRK